MRKIPQFVSFRARARHPIFTADEVSRWPAGQLEQLIKSAFLSPAANANSIACDACNDDHCEEVQYVESPAGSKLRAYICCPECGRVEVPLERLRQWNVNLEKNGDLEYCPDVTRADTKAPPASQAGSPHQGVAAFVDDPISERAQLVLVAMLELEAFDSDRRQSTEVIACAALGEAADANALKAVMADLKTRHLVKSKTGRGGGCWLTNKGRARAEKLS